MSHTVLKPIRSETSPNPGEPLAENQLVLMKLLTLLAAVILGTAVLEIPTLATTTKPSSLALDESTREKGRCEGDCRIFRSAWDMNTWGHELINKFAVQLVDQYGVVYTSSCMPLSSDHQARIAKNRHGASRVLDGPDSQTACAKLCDVFGETRQE